MTKVCGCCKEELPVELFYKRRDTGELRNTCKICIARKAKERNKKPEAIEANRVRSRRHLLKAYGLTEESFQDLLKSQDFKCKICNIDLLSTGSQEDLVKIACVDHCHHTGVVRGILCRKCNSGIGYFGDNLELLEKAVSYLKE